MENQPRKETVCISLTNKFLEEKKFETEVVENNQTGKSL